MKKAHSEPMWGIRGREKEKEGRGGERGEGEKKEGGLCPGLRKDGEEEGKKGRVTEENQEEGKERGTCNLPSRFLSMRGGGRRGRGCERRR